MLSVSKKTINYNKIRVSELNYVIGILNLIYDFNELVKFVKKFNFEKYFIRTANVIYFKYPKWDKIYTVLGYFSKYILDENDRNRYNIFIESYKNNNDLKIYYHNLINS